MDKNNNSPNICQRLVNYFMLGNVNRAPTLPRSTQVPTTDEDGPSRNQTGWIESRNGEPNGYVGSEIVVEFRHARRSISEKSIDIGEHEEGLEVSSKGNKRNMQYKNLDDDQSNMASIGPKTVRPSLSGPSNIDQRVDEYIKSRKKAMRMDELQT
ncbi:hypothetical protein OROMI_015742 [Orobanche minor]